MDNYEIKLFVHSRHVYEKTKSFIHTNVRLEDFKLLKIFMITTSTTYTNY